MASVKQRVAHVGQIDFFSHLLPPSIENEPASQPAQPAIQPYYETKQPKESTQPQKPVEPEKPKPPPIYIISALEASMAPAPTWLTPVGTSKLPRPRAHRGAQKPAKMNVVWPVPGVTVLAPDFGYSGFGTSDSHLDGEVGSNGADVKMLSEDDMLDTQLAELMFMRMKYDLSYLLEPNRESELDLIASFQEVDMFGSTATAVCHNIRMMDKLDAIIWLYDFNPDKVLISFEWVCFILSLDAEQVRRIVARTLHAEILQAIDLVAEMVDPHHAKLCEEKIFEYVNVGARKNP